MRLKANSLRLYHETNEDNASKILQSGRMYRGRGGWAGPGIYFAKTPAATHAKSHNKGVVLSADVLLGTVKYVSGTETGLSNTCFTNLQAEGFDSVCITASHSGEEYVVYNYDQVQNIQRFNELQENSEMAWILPSSQNLVPILNPNQLYLVDF